MTRPHITVTVADAPPAINPGSLTSTTFLNYPAATGQAKPVAVRSAKEALAAGATVAAQQQVSDLITEGASTVVLNRLPFTAGDLATADDEDILDALAAPSTTEFGVGQVIIPGAVSVNAHSALLDHAAATGRTVLLDVAPNATAADLVTLATPLRTRQGAERAGLIAGSVLVPIVGGSTRTVAGSIVAAGATARMDARVGHANRMVAFTQSFGDAGLSRVGTAGATTSFSDADLDDLSDAGIIPIVDRPNGATIYDWLSLSDDPDWSQLNFGRLAMQIGATAGSYLEQFLGEPIDGQGQLFATIEAGLAGSVFMPLFQANAIYPDADGNPFTVQVSGITTPAEVAAGIIHAAASVVFTRGARQVLFDVTVRQPGAVEVAA